jgi:hypothetical protein
LTTFAADVAAEDLRAHAAPGRTLLASNFKTVLLKPFGGKFIGWNAVQFDVV